MSDAAMQPVYFLLVDDREQNLIALESLLRRDGLVLLKASTGTEALEHLLQHEVALALIDVQMPGMDGFELAELMRGTERTRRVPIIFLTAGNADQRRKFRGYEAGAVDFLQKPLEPDILRSKTKVFFDLCRERQEVARQRDELAAMIAENTRLLEESRQFANALQGADRRKDEFLATLGHELRNPLAPILNAAQAMRLVDSEPEEIRNLQIIIERQANHMARLVDDLLDVSRITRGKIHLRMGEVDLAQVVESAVETSRPMLEAGRHQFSVAMPAEPVLVQGDIVRLGQVLANLLNNAAKYTPEGGKVAVHLATENGQAVIRVSDTGLGIPAEMLDNVFEIFTQVNRYLNRAQGGLGIGLALVKRLVEMHGGTVEVQSEGEGKGAEFIVRLPLGCASPHEGKAISANRPNRRGQSQRIVVIDDNLDAMNSLRMLLKACGHEVKSADNGASGIELIEQFNPSVVLLDLGMPDIDGFETAKRIRQLPIGQHVKLIALTGWGQNEDRLRSRDAGFDHHLVKPIDMPTLHRLLNGTDPNTQPRAGA